MNNKAILLPIFLGTVIAGLLVAVGVMAWTNPSADPPSGSGALYYSGGNVGIGTTNPTAELEVVGTVSSTAIHFPDGTTQTTAAATSTNYWSISSVSLYPTSTAYNLGVGTASLDSNYKITTSGGGIKAESTDQPAGYFSSTSGYGLLVNSGNVGIGTTAPGTTLHVIGSSTISNGNLRIASSSYGLVFSDGTLQTTAFTGSLGITSLNGSTSSTQTFSSANDSLTISTANGVHTFTALASSTWLKVANNLSDLNSTTTAKSNLGMANVENTALSTWAGSANITTLGTIGTGVWNGTEIGIAKGGTGGTSSSTARANLGLYFKKTITVPAPTSTAADYVTNNITLGHFDNAFTISKVSCINVGAGNSVTFQMPHGTDRSAAGTNLFSAGQVCSNSTSSIEYTSFNDATLDADEMIWLSFSAASSTQTSITIFGNY